MKGGIIVKLNISDDDTGEIVDTIEEDEKYYKVNYYDSEIKKIKKNHFFKLFRNSVYVITNEKMNYPTLKILFRLFLLLQFESQYVMIDGLPANMKRVSAYFKLGSRTFNNYIKKLEELEILKRVKSSTNGRNKQILINPYFVSFGAKPTNEAISIFRNSSWARKLNKK